MDWKSTAVISAAGILATWFFSMPASRAPVPGAIPPAARAPQSAAAVDIQREAARLQVRLHQPPPYTEPSRNLFRFGQRRVEAAGTSGAPVRPAVILPETPLPPPPPRITLDGIASDTVGDQPQRTAILNTEAGVVLAREGQQVAGYRVAKIGADAVELVKLDDGSTLRLALR